MATAILWFRNDLRLHDNEALIKALEYDRFGSILQKNKRAAVMPKQINSRLWLK